MNANHWGSVGDGKFGRNEQPGDSEGGVSSFQRSLDLIAISPLDVFQGIRLPSAAVPQKDGGWGNSRFKCSL